jgi:hypothetical protein
MSSTNVDRLVMFLGSKRRRHPPRLPYTLVPRIADLFAVPLGRRKAIEVGDYAQPETYFVSSVNLLNKVVSSPINP